jgi:hypothetical protein
MRKTGVIIGIWLALLLGAATVPFRAAGQEPSNVTGAWKGTWWMGKYEQPAALEITQTGTHLAGTLSVWGHPSTDAGVVATALEARVTGEVDGLRIRIAGTTPDERRFHAELILVTPLTLLGFGQASGGAIVGFELSRPHASRNQGPRLPAHVSGPPPTPRDPDEELPTVAATTGQALGDRRCAGMTSRSCTGR